ncbi:MAG: SCO family protein [Alphaproteobacteria bacterium]
MTGRAIVCAIFLTLLVIPVSAYSHDHNGHTAHAPHAMPNVAPGGDMGAFPANIGGPFRLRDADGRKVDSRQDFTGRIVMLFFGYARCPGICPTALDAMEHALDLLPGEKAGKVQPVMITIDPEHDTAEILRTDFSREHPRIMGLTGSEAQIKTATDAYKINKVLVHTTAEGEPVYAHGSWIYLLDGGGNLSGILPPNASAEDIASAVGRRL